MCTALRNQMFFSSTAKKNFAKWHVYFSLLRQEQTVLLCSLDIPLFCFFDLTYLNFFEFILPQQQQQQQQQYQQIQAKLDQSQNSTSVKQGAIFSKYRKSNIFNTKHSLSCHLLFRNDNDKIYVLSS